MAKAGGPEILIRGADGIRFRRYDPSEVFLRLRPKPAPGVEVEENVVDDAAGRMHIIHNRQTGKYMRLDDREYFLWEQMDGLHDMRDLAAAFFMNYGLCDVSELAGFLNKARALGLVEVRETGLFRTRHLGTEAGAIQRAWAWLNTYDRRWEGADRLFRKLYRVLGPIYSLWALPLLLALMGLGGYFYATERFDGRFAAVGVGGLIYAAALVVSLLVFLILHEFSHGLAVLSFGRSVKAVGFTFLDRLLPCVYVDITDMWMSTRGGRIAVSIAGPAANIVLAGLLAAVAHVISSPVVSWVAYVGADANLIIAIATAWPFLGIREDGFNAYSDIVKVAALRTRSLAMLRGMLRGEGRRRDLSGARAAMGIYLILTILSLTALLGLGVVQIF